jgi:dTDP-4-dehydrorhamnose 3,5-epimerase
MQFIKVPLPNTWVIFPAPHKDHRGRFMRAWCSEEFQNQGISFLPVQANMGFNIKKGTIRGMHFQRAPALEAKLVRCTKGAIYDVALDIIPESSTYGCWYGVELSAENGKMLYVPEQYAHGYQTLEDNSEIYYLTSGYYIPDLATGVRFNDPFFNIKWPIPVTSISDQDCNWPLVRTRETIK